MWIDACLAQNLAIPSLGNVGVLSPSHGHAWVVGWATRTIGLLRLAKCSNIVWAKVTQLRRPVRCPTTVRVAGWVTWVTCLHCPVAQHAFVQRNLGDNKFFEFLIFKKKIC